MLSAGGNVQVHLRRHVSLYLPRLRVALNDRGRVSQTKSRNTLKH